MIPQPCYTVRYSTVRSKPTSKVHETAQNPVDSGEARGRERKFDNTRVLCCTVRYSAGNSTIQNLPNQLTNQSPISREQYFAYEHEHVTEEHAARLREATRVTSYDNSSVMGGPTLRFLTFFFYCLGKWRNCQ